MANRNTDRNRYENRQQDYDQRSRQSEQFQTDGDRQVGDSDYRYDRNSARSDSRYGRNADRQSQQYANRGYAGEDYDPLGDYDRASYGADAGYQMGRTETHSYFRPDDFGGEDYSRGGYSGAGTRASQMGRYGRGAYATGRDPYGTNRQYDRSYDRNEDRGFFDRAGDEIASWFGDDDAARRREMDHRGRGPANYERSNERLLEDACERLTHDRLVDARNINVTVADNEITLDGTVDSRLGKRRAEDCVHDIAGVKHVQNNLRIKDSGTDTANTLA